MTRSPESEEDGSKSGVKTYTRGEFITKLPGVALRSTAVTAAAAEVAIHTISLLFSRKLEATLSPKLPKLSNGKKWQYSPKVNSTRSQTNFFYTDTDDGQVIKDVENLEKLFDKIGAWMMVTDNFSTSTFEISKEEKNEEKNFMIDVAVVNSILSHYTGQQCKITIVFNGRPNGYRNNTPEEIYNAPMACHFLNYLFYNVEAYKKGYVSLSPFLLISPKGTVFKFHLSQEKFDQLFLQISLDISGSDLLDNIGYWWQKFETIISKELSQISYLSQNSLSSFLKIMKDHGYYLEIHKTSEF